MKAALSKVKDKYIDIYFENHKKKRLDITEAQRRGKIQEGRALACVSCVLSKYYPLLATMYPKHMTRPNKIEKRMLFMRTQTMYIATSA